MKSFKGITVVFGPIRVPRRGIRLTLDGPNPGMGGTEFQTALLALHLFNRYPEMKISLAQVGYSVVTHPGIDLSVFESEVNFFPAAGSIVIGPAWNLSKVPPANLESVAVVAQSHHPHDEALGKVSKKNDLALATSVGYYSFLANRVPDGVPHLYIPNLFAPASLSTQSARAPDLPTNPLVGHISSLHPAKGFVEVAKAWKQLKKEVPTARLEVIGSLSLYGNEFDRHPRLPMDLEQGQLVERILGSHIDSVTFLGRIDHGIDHIASRWTVAILNPLGTSESDPASFKDLLRVGVPTVAGYDFGLIDYLADFPELRINRPRDAAKVAAELIHNKKKRTDISGRMAHMAERLRIRNSTIISVWGEVLWVLGNGFQPHQNNLDALLPFTANFPLRGKFRISRRNLSSQARNRSRRFMATIRQPGSTQSKLHIRPQ